MAMPDDLGAPLAETERAPAGRDKILSVNTPIGVIASSPQGRAVLERRLPGLCERPEYMMFKSMSLAKLALLSHGRISTGKLDQLQADLIRVDLIDEPVHRHNPLTDSGRSIGRLSHSLYRRVVMVIAAL